MPRRRPFKRTDRLASQIRQVLATAISRESREEVLHRVVVSDVDVTSDISLARVYYYVLDLESVTSDGDASVDDAAVEAALERASRFLRRRVGEEIRARVTPELRFIKDTSIERGRRIEELLAEIAPGLVDDDVDADDADESEVVDADGGEDEAPDADDEAPERQ